MQTFELSHFDDFLAIARQQNEPQTLLLILAKRELPVGHTAEQARLFEAGQGGHLAPLAGVDKSPQDLIDFESFVSESRHVAKDWDAVFVAALPGTDGNMPNAKATDKAIEQMLHGIRNGIINNYLVFDRKGEPLNLNES